MSILTSVAGLLTCAISVAGNLGVQDDPVLIMQTAVQAVQAELPQGRHVLDHSEGASVNTNALGSSMDMPLSTLTNTRVCASRAPSSCQLENASAVIRVGDPQVSDNVALVPIQVWYQTASERQPVAWKKVTVHLNRDNGEWKAGKIELIEIS